MPTVGPRFRSVESPHYHVWTDALHARGLARKTKDRWDQGTYVRWAVGSAWTAFEAACGDALGAKGLGNRFKEKLNEALVAGGFNKPDWGSGLWQEVIKVYDLRKDYMHLRIDQSRLFPPLEEADHAVDTLRTAIKDIYARAGKPVPSWPDDDIELMDPRGSMTHLSVLRKGSDAPDAVRICYVVLGREYESEVCAPGTDPVPLMEDLLRRIRVPVSEIRAYQGNQLIESWKVQMRGSS